MSHRGHRTIHHDLIVLGGGITGTVIGGITGGQVVSSGELSLPSPFFVHATNKTKEWANEVFGPLSGPVKTKQSSIGYGCYDKLIVPTYDDLGKYARKKCRKWYCPQDFKYLDLSIGQLEEGLRPVVKSTIRDPIQRIDLEGHVLHGRKNDYTYNQLISTIPAPSFAKLSGNLAKMSEFTFIKIRSSHRSAPPYGSNHWSLYDYIYFCDDSPLLRFTPDVAGNGGVIEYLSADYNQVGIIDGKPDKYEGVTFAGRFGRWDEHWSLDDDIKRWYK